MSRSKVKLPLPSRCAGCGIAIKPIRHMVDHTAVVVWVHDAPIMMVLRKGGSHEPVPDPAYQPQQGRTVTTMRTRGVDGGGWDAVNRPSPPRIMLHRHHIRATMVA